MSQFKSRLPGSLLFTTDRGADQGYCCNSTGDGGYTGSTRYECFLKNGFFIPASSEIEAKNKCPKVQKGTCCKYNSTTRALISSDTGVTYCNCSTLNPTYTGYLVDYIQSGSCPTTKSSFAPENGACCYWKKTGDTYIHTCESVSSVDVCLGLHEGTDEGLKFAFYLGESCVADGGNIACNSGKGLTETEKSNNPDCQTDTLQDCNSQQNILGNCCTLLDNGNRQCSITIKDDCAGFWSYLGVVKGCSGSTLCSGVYFPEKIETEYFPTTASLSTVTNSGNLIEKIPTSPDMYQGGLYVGIFQPGSTINISGSMVYGNTSTGDAKQYRARGTGPGTRNKRWILIAAPSDITLPAGTVLDHDKDTSTYDGFYNTSGKNVSYFSNVRNIEINGFSDWYIPSQDELAYFFNTISSSFTTNNYTPLSENYYLTSTNYSVGSDNKIAKIADTDFVYGQSAISTLYGKVILMPQNNLSNCKVRLFRRIYLGN